MHSLLRIAIVIGSLRFGGAERFCVDLANALAKKGHNVTIISLSVQIPLRCELNNVNVICLKNNRFSVFLNIIALTQLFIRHKFQVIDTHLFLSSFYARIAAFFARTAVIVTHEHTLTPWKKSYHRLLELLLSKITDKVICVSKTVAVKRIHDEKINISKIDIIPIGIDLNRFKPKYPKWSKNVGFVGRFVPAKNLFQVIEVYHRVQLFFPNTKLILIGDGPLRDVIEKTITARQLDGRIEITGFVKNVEDFLESISILILLSVREGLPVCILEAMAAGIPVVATQVGAIPEIIVNGKNGFLVCINDVQGTSNIIVDLLRKDEMRKRMGENSQITAAKYDIKTIAQKTATLYESLLRTKRN